jgi:hypothetical protein
MVNPASLFNAYRRHNGLSAMLTTRLHLAPWLRMGRVIPLLPLYAHVMCKRKAVLLPFMCISLWANRVSPILLKFTFHFRAYWVSNEMERRFEMCSTKYGFEGGTYGLQPGSMPSLDRREWSGLQRTSLREDLNYNTSTNVSIKHTCSVPETLATSVS